MELSKKLPSLTNSQREYPFKYLFKKVGYYWKKGEVWCQCCGHVDKVLQPILAVSLGVGGHTCPKCGTELSLEHWNQSNRKYSNESKYYSVVQHFRGWMVVRTFDIQRNNTKGADTHRFMSEVFQNWISEDGRVEIILGKKYTRSPFHFSWCYDSEMDVKFHNKHCTGSYEMEDVFDVSGNYLYPRASVHSLLKRNGWTNQLLKLRVSVVDAIKQLLTNPTAETIVKTGQLRIFEYMLRKSDYTVPYWHALNICNRNHYIIKDATLWFDYLDLLSDFNFDTHNSCYVCPKDLKAEHDKLMIRKNKRQLEDRLKEAAKWENQYKREKGAFFDICFRDDDIVISVLHSVSEFVEEGQNMHHCVFTNGYFKKKDTLILSAKDKEGKRIETIELNLRSMQIIQSRSVCNGISEYHDRIIKLVKKNMNLIRQKMTA